MSVEATAVSSIGSAVESGISHSAAPAMSSIGVGGTFEGHFSPSYLGTLPEHTINPSSLNTDRVVPLPEMVFNQKLFEVVYQAQEKPSKVSLPDFLGLPEYRIDPDSFADKTELTPISAKLIWEQEDRFPFIYQAPKVPDKPKAEPAAIFGALQQEEPNSLFSEAKPIAVEEEAPGPLVFNEPNTQLAQREADTHLVEDVKEQLQDQSVWSAEEKTFWENLFERAVTTHVQTESSEETEAKITNPASTKQGTYVEAQTQASSGAGVEAELELMEQTDILPPDITAIGQGDQEEKQPQKSPVWQIYQINSLWETAKKELEDRIETARDVVRKAFQAGDPLEAMTEMAYRLDKPGIDATLKISEGRLIYPQIANRVHDLEENSDLMKITPEGIEQALEDIVVENKPDEQKVKVNHVATVEQEALAPQARKLAEAGAMFIVEKDGQMKAVSTPQRQFPQEMDKTE